MVLPVKNDQSERAIIESQNTQTLVVENHDSFVDDSAFKVVPTDSKFTSEQSNQQLQDANQYAIDFVGTLGPCDSPMRPYQITSSCETTEAAENKNRHL